MGETMLIYIEKYIIVWYYLEIGIITGVLFCLSYTQLRIETKLIGSSAVLFGFLGYLTYIIPNKRVYIFGRYLINFSILSIAMVLICILQIAINYNLGGNVAHLIGYAIGLILSIITKYIYNLK